MEVTNLTRPASIPDTDVFTSIVSRTFRVEEMSTGDPKRGYFLRYRGQLLTDSELAYDQLAGALAPHAPELRLGGEGAGVITPPLLHRGVLTHEAGIDTRRERRQGAIPVDPQPTVFVD